MPDLSFQVEAADVVSNAASPLLAFNLRLTDANAEQVRRGMAWVDKRHNKSTSPLYFLEDTAQRAHEGLWAANSPVPPWIWRQDRRHR